MDADARTAREALGRIRVGGLGGQAVVTTVLGLRVVAGGVGYAGSGHWIHGDGRDDTRESTPRVRKLAAGSLPATRWDPEGGAGMVT